MRTYRLSNCSQLRDLIKTITGGGYQNVPSGLCQSYVSHFKCEKNTTALMPVIRLKSGS